MLGEPDFSRNLFRTVSAVFPDDFFGYFCGYFWVYRLVERATIAKRRMIETSNSLSGALS